MNFSQFYLVRNRKLTVSIKLFAFATILLFASSMTYAYETAAVLSGIAKVKDGDGVLFGQVEVRLQGIAAPEDRRGERTKIGRESSENLKTLVEGKALVCHLDGTTAGRSNRPAGICYLNGLDIGLHQVETGHARDCPRYSKGRYSNAEAKAQKNGIDLSAVYKLPRYC